MRMADHCPQAVPLVIHPSAVVLAAAGCRAVLQPPLAVPLASAPLPCIHPAWTYRAVCAAPRDGTCGCRPRPLVHLAWTCRVQCTAAAHGGIRISGCTRSEPGQHQLAGALPCGLTRGCKAWATMHPYLAVRPLEECCADC